MEMEKEQDVLGVLEPGKRIVRKEQQDVTREEFEAQQVFCQYLFGERGLADTLGPTWQMIHDPRFVAIENSFIKHKGNRFIGGDATQGVNRQQPDGSFASGVEDLNQYGEILGEGRYFHTVLRSMAYHKAIGALWPNRKWAIPKKEFLPGIFVFNKLAVEDQQEVVKLAATYTEFFPKNLSKQTDGAIWYFIKQECPNYFNKKLVANRVGQDLFRMLKLDLVGLIDDYAELAKIQEWVLLDHENTLVEQKHIDDDAPRIWAEVEILEKALTVRASLRVTANQVLKMLGLNHYLEDHDIKLTDLERDKLLQIIYASKFPDDGPQLVTQILGYLAGIQTSGKALEERQKEQCLEASAEAKAYIAKLKSGEEQPITRVSEPGDDENLNELSGEERIAQEIMHNPIKQMVFIRYAAVEKKQLAAEERIADIRRELTDFEHQKSLINGTHDPLCDCDPDPSAPRDLDALTAYRYRLSEEATALTTAVANYGKVIELLAPVFQSAEFELTEEAAADLLIAAEAYDSTAMKTVPHPEDVAAAETTEG